MRQIAAIILLTASLQPKAAAAQDFTDSPEDVFQRTQRKDNHFAGFDFCPPPHAPDCIERAAKGKALAECEEEVRIYIETVFAYRECLAFETERAVRESNDALDRWKCRKSGANRCK